MSLLSLLCFVLFLFVLDVMIMMMNCNRFPFVLYLFENVFVSNGHLKSFSGFKRWHVQSGSASMDQIK